MTRALIAMGAAFAGALWIAWVMTDLITRYTHATYPEEIAALVAVGAVALLAATSGFIWAVGVLQRAMSSVMEPYEKEE